VGALRFFFIKTLRKAWSVEETPYPKKRLHLPVILSQDEVSRLIESVRRLRGSGWIDTDKRARVRRCPQSSIVSSTRPVIVAGASSRANATVLSKPCGPVSVPRPGRGPRRCRLRTAEAFRRRRSRGAIRWRCLGGETGGFTKPPWLARATTGAFSIGCIEAKGLNWLPGGTWFRTTSPHLMR
jgi:hypothetical protein